MEGQEVNLEISMITGVKSGCTRRIKGIYIQDIDNLHKLIKVLFTYSQEKITASQEYITRPDYQGCRIFSSVETSNSTKRDACITSKVLR